MSVGSGAPAGKPPVNTRRVLSVRIVIVLSMLLVLAPALLGDSFNPFYRDLVFFYPNYWAAQVF